MIIYSDDIWRFLKHSKLVLYVTYEDSLLFGIAEEAKKRYYGLETWWGLQEKNAFKLTKDFIFLPYKEKWEDSPSLKIIEENIDALIKYDLKSYIAFSEIEEEGWKQIKELFINKLKGDNYYLIEKPDNDKRIEELKSIIELARKSGWRVINKKRICFYNQVQNIRIYVYKKYSIKDYVFDYGICIRNNVEKKLSYIQCWEVIEQTKGYMYGCR